MPNYRPSTNQTACPHNSNYCLFLPTAEITSHQSTTFYFVFDSWVAPKCSRRLPTSPSSARRLLAS